MSDTAPLQMVRFNGKLYSGQVRIRSEKITCVFQAELTRVEFLYDPFSATVMTNDLSCAAAVGRMKGQLVHLCIGEPGATHIQTEVYLHDVHERRLPRHQLTLWLSKYPVQ